jgi:ribosomal protein S1
MKKIFSMIAMCALVCFTTAVFAADAADPMSALATKANASVQSETAKALNGDIVAGTIKKIDKTANTILIRDQTIKVKPDQLAELKEGDKVKVTLVSGTMTAKKILPLGKEGANKKAKKEVNQAKTKAVETATDEAVKKVSE